MNELTIANCIADYKAQRVDEIDLFNGKSVIVFKMDESGWWLGELDEQYGKFPGNHVTVLEEKEANKAHNQRKINQGLVDLRRQSAEADSKMDQLNKEIMSLTTELLRMDKELETFRNSTFPATLSEVIEKNKHFIPTLESYIENSAKNQKSNEVCLKMGNTFVRSMEVFCERMNENDKISKKLKKRVTKGEGDLAAAFDVAAELYKENSATRETVFENRENYIEDLAALQQLIIALTKK